MIGTPFHHQGRVPGHGVDCVGLVILSFAAAGHEFKDYTAYGRHPNPRQLMEQLSSNGLVRIPSLEHEEGDVLLFQYRLNMPQHMAIATDVGMIHAWRTAGKVYEHPMNDLWLSRLHSVWRI